jgi:hypothetical protein
MDTAPVAEQTTCKPAVASEGSTPSAMYRDMTPMSALLRVHKHRSCFPLSPPAPVPVLYVQYNGTGSKEADPQVLNPTAVFGGYTLAITSPAK